jgi:hypothetical protein
MKYIVREMGVGVGRESLDSGSECGNTVTSGHLAHHDASHAESAESELGDQMYPEQLDLQGSESGNTVTSGHLAHHDASHTGSAVRGLQDQRYPEELYLHTLKLACGVRTCSIDDKVFVSDKLNERNQPILSLKNETDVEKLYDRFQITNPIGEPPKSGIKRIDYEMIGMIYAGLEIAFDCNYLKTHGRDFVSTEVVSTEDAPIENVESSARCRYPILTFFDVCSGCIWDLEALSLSNSGPEEIKLSDLVAKFGPAAEERALSRGGGGSSLAPWTIVSILVVIASSLAGSAT